MILHLPARLASRTKPHRSELHVGQPSLGTFPQRATSSPRGVFFCFSMPYLSTGYVRGHLRRRRDPSRSNVGFVHQGKKFGGQFFWPGPQSRTWPHPHKRGSLFEHLFVACVNRNSNVLCGPVFFSSNLCAVLWCMVHLER